MSDMTRMFRLNPAEDIGRFAERLDRLNLLFQIIGRLARHPESDPDGDLISLAEMGRSDAEALADELRCAGVEVSGGVTA
ncbi:MAG: hypothetical protein ACYCVW_15235 [Rhodocyclaceae bacterium]